MSTGPIGSATALPAASGTAAPSGGVVLLPMSKTTPPAWLAQVAVVSHGGHAVFKDMWEDISAKNLCASGAGSHLFSL